MNAQPQSLVPDEDHSTGTAWHVDRSKAPGRLPAYITPCTPAQQAQHRADLEHAIAGFAVGRALNRPAVDAASPHGPGR